MGSHASYVICMSNSEAQGTTAYVQHTTGVKRLSLSGFVNLFTERCLQSNAYPRSLEIREEETSQTGKVLGFESKQKGFGSVLAFMCSCEYLLRDLKHWILS